MRDDTPISVSTEPLNNLAASTRPPVLLVEHLTKRFGDRLAVDDVSFSVTAGEVFGFLGPNGAGKTTTVRMLATLISPSSGSAIVAGIPLLAENGLEIRQRLAVMPENPGLYLRLSVAENLEFFAGVYGISNRLEEAERLCDRVAILNTSLRTIGRPDELRDRLFVKALIVRTAAPLPDPDRVFAVPGIDSWRADDTARYVLSVSDTHTAAPEIARALVASGADILSLSEDRHSLEDVYLELIDDDAEAHQ